MCLKSEVHSQPLFVNQAASCCFDDTPTARVLVLRVGEARRLHLAPAPRACTSRCISPAPRLQLTRGCAWAQGVRIVVACVEVGPSSNVEAFIAEFERLKKNAVRIASIELQVPFPPFTSRSPLRCTA